MDGEFAGAGAEQVAAGADVIAEIEEFVEFETFIADGVLLDVNLQPLSCLLQVREPGLAHEAHGHESTGNADLRLGGLQFLGGLAGVPGEDLRNRVRCLELVRISLLVEGFNPAEFVAAELVDFFVAKAGRTS